VGSAIAIHSLARDACLAPQMNTPITRDEFQKLLAKLMNLQLSSQALDILFHLYSNKNGTLDAAVFLDVFSRRHAIRGKRVSIFFSQVAAAPYLRPSALTPTCLGAVPGNDGRLVSGWTPALHSEVHHGFVTPYSRQPWRCNNLTKGEMTARVTRPSLH
jgi:hypothetical protein